MGAIGLFGLKEAGGRRKSKGGEQMSTGEISVPPAPSFPASKARMAVRSRLPSEDPVDQLERLSRLRERGSITQEEFETLKGKIVKDGG